MNLLALVVATATVSSSGWIDTLSDSVSGRVRAASGAEWDTNAKRAIEGADAAQQEADVVADGLVRVLFSAQGRLRLGEAHSISANYLLGAKRFFTEQSQDIAAHDLTVSSGHRLSQSVFLGASGRYRASRIRDEARNRDYSLGTGGLNLTWYASPNWRLSGSGNFVANRFYGQPFYDYAGAQTSVRLGFSPHRKLWFNASGRFTYRHYFSDSYGVVQEFDNDQAVGEPSNALCVLLQEKQVCTQMLTRRDNEGNLTLGVLWRGSFLLAADYVLRVQRSNIDNENVNRHRIQVQGTFAFPWSLSASLVGAVQFSDGLSTTVNAVLAEDDESQNSLILKLSKGITEELALELRYSLFANQFSTADVSFLRQTIYLGVSFATGI